jgi:hypothetical protein
MIEIEGSYVTFHPPRQAAYLIGDFTDRDDKSLPIDGPKTLEFPPGAYIEYAYLDANNQPLADPTNQERPKSPWHDYDRALTLPRSHTTNSRHHHDHSAFEEASTSISSIPRPASSAGRIMSMNHLSLLW